MRKQVFLACVACFMAAALGFAQPGAVLAAASLVRAPLPEVGPLPVVRGNDVRALMRRVLHKTQDPVQVAHLLAKKGVRFQGHQAVGVRFARDAAGVPTPWLIETTTVGADLGIAVERQVLDQAQLGAGVEILAGRKYDFLLRQWLYEWTNADGTFTVESVTTGTWFSPEWRWIARPADVIDVRWVVGHLAYVAAYPYDGVAFDQQTQGAASFTVDDLVTHWTLFVDFTPASNNVYGTVTNVFTNYTHTYLGLRLGVTLGAGSNGATGSVTVNTDARSWMKGVGLALRIGNNESRGPASSRNSDLDRELGHGKK